MKASLEGIDAAWLWELPIDCSDKELPELTDMLWNRFGDSDQTERFRAQLRNCGRQKDETIQQVYQDVCSLLVLSYPGETGALSTIVGRYAFIDALRD